MAEKTLNIMIAAGGTAGHINPALALAEELRDRGHKISFVGQPTRLEAELVPQAGFDFFAVDVTGFDRSRPWTLVSALVRLKRAENKLGDYFKQHVLPDVCVGFGAYVELPLVSFAKKHKIPFVIHEQNSVPGLANKVAAKSAACIACAFPEAVEALSPHAQRSAQVLLTGNPVRRIVRDAKRTPARRTLKLKSGEKLLLIFGGSLGAHHINEALVALKDELLAQPGLRIVHSSGADDFESTKEALALSEEEQARWDLRPYINNMGEALAAADLVLSRAGASSIAEIAALAVPSILVPYPLATADHQTTNAQLLVGAGAAELISDDELDSDKLKSTLFELLEDESRLKQMKAAARALKQDEAASSLANIVESLGK